MSHYRTTNSSSLLSDNSWIKKVDEEDEAVDRDPNYARTVLHRSLRTEDEPTSPETVSPVSSRTSSSSYVQDITRRFQDGSSSSDSIQSPTRSSIPRSSTTTTVNKDGTTETTTTTTTLRSSVSSSPTQTFTERVKSSSKGSQYTTYSPTKTTKVTKTTVSSQDPEDNLYDTLIPSITDNYSDSKTTISTTETVRVTSSSDGDDIKTTTTRTSSTAEDDLYDTLLPRGITSPSVSTSIKKSEITTVKSGFGGDSPTLSSPSYTRKSSSSYSYNDDSPSRTTSYSISSLPSDSYSSEYKNYSYSRPDSSSSTSTSSYTTSYRSSSRSDDVVDPIYSKSSSRSQYASTDRVVLDKDLCSYCHKSFTGDAKMVLDDMKINCHASCFKCQVCNNTLAHLKAGDSLWVYRRMVHCDNCFEATREKWRR